MWLGWHSRWLSELIFVQGEKLWQTIIYIYIYIYIYVCVCVCVYIYIYIYIYEHIHTDLDISCSVHAYWGRLRIYLTRREWHFVPENGKMLTRRNTKRHVESWTRNTRRPWKNIFLWVPLITCHLLLTADYWPK